MARWAAQWPFWNSWHEAMANRSSSTSASAAGAVRVRPIGEVCSPTRKR